MGRFRSVHKISHPDGGAAVWRARMLWECCSFFQGATPIERALQLLRPKSTDLGRRCWASNSGHPGPCLPGG